MILGGFQRFSLIDYPGKICTILFTQGCNFRCPYCHNPELIGFKSHTTSIKQEEVFSFLEKRRGKLDAVSITGGEPTLQPDLIGFLGKIKGMGYLIKLDSNGSHPEALEKIIEKGVVDYLAMDVKGPLKKYKRIVNFNANIDKIKESISLIMNSGLDYEFRTTIVKSQLSPEDIVEVGKTIKNAKLYILQKFVPSKTLAPNFLNEKTYSDGEFEQFKEALRDCVDLCIVR